MLRTSSSLPLPRTGSDDGGSEVDSRHSGTHFRLQVRHGTSRIKANGAVLWLYGTCVNAQIRFSLRRFGVITDGRGLLGLLGL
jgi:hypothetical protein